MKLKFGPWKWMFSSSIIMEEFHSVWFLTQNLMTEADTDTGYHNLVM